MASTSTSLLHGETVGDSLKAANLCAALRTRVALLTGGRDKQGRPIVLIPPHSSTDGPDYESLRLVIRYLTSIPSEEVKEVGFTVLVDMRQKTPWNAVKPVLKVLDVLLTTVEELYKYVDINQLTSEFDGTLVYDHEEWIELRVAIEDLIWRIMDTLSTLDTIRGELERPEVHSDSSQAKKALDDLGNTKRRIARAPVEELEVETQQLIQRLNNHYETDSSGCGDSDYGSGCREPLQNPDLVSAVPHLTALVENMRSTRQQLYAQLQDKRQKADQAFQLKLLEQDADKMFKWVRQNVELFLASYADIGDGYERAKQCQAEHQQFASAAMNVGVNVDHIMRVAGRLLDGGHYAQMDIKALANRLEQDWHLFTSALERRSQLLALSVLFHLKSEQYLRQIEGWSVAIRGGQEMPYTVPDLELAISQHQELMDSITGAYTEAINSGKSLADALKAPPLKRLPASGIDGHTGGKSNETMGTVPSPDYSAGASHVLDLLHRLLNSHRDMEQLWQDRRLRLHQRLALLLFQQDVQQVLDWLDQHGELFLRKNPGVGKTLQRARALQRSHQHFQQVTQNTYRNAEKLLHAATELAGMGEAAPEEVYELAGRLKERVYTFDRQVQSRKKLLECAVLFFTHYKELMAWFQEVERADGETRYVGPDLTSCEQKLEEWLERNNATLEATETTLSEGRQLLAMLRQSQQASTMTENESRVELGESVGSVQEMFSEVERRQDNLKNVWQVQHLQLNLAIQTRLFSQDCHMVIGQLEGWCEDMRWICGHLSPSQADQYLPIQQENNARVQSSISEIMQNADELEQALSTCEPCLLIAESERSVLEEVHCLCEKVAGQQKTSGELAAHTLERLQQAVDLGQLQTMASRALSWIQQEEQLLFATLAVPSSFAESDQLSKDHDHFQNTIKGTHPNIVRVQERASAMLSSDHYAAGEVHSIAEQVLTRWRQLCTSSEDRHKLLKSALTYYKTIEQVVPVLDRLESEYEKGEDCCMVLYKRALEHDQPGSNTKTKIDFVRDQLNRHLKNKESFLKGCSLARKNCELFEKYIRRQLAATTNSVNFPSSFSAKGLRDNLESKIAQFLNELQPRETRILELWTQRKRKLDQCQQFVLFEASAQQVLDWLHKEGEPYLAVHRRPSNKRDENEKALEEHKLFRIRVKEQRERVRVLCEIQNGLGAVNGEAREGPSPKRPPLNGVTPVHVGLKGDNIHGPEIKQWVDTVQSRYQDLAARLDKYQGEIVAALGKEEGLSKDLTLDRCSDSSLESKLREDLTPERRKSLRKIELVMQELLNTERAYINDLDVCIKHFFDGMLKAGNVPVPLRGKEKDIFCNIRDIYDFHKGTFLAELEGFEALAEDVAHVFNKWALSFSNLYVPYCCNKEASNALLTGHDAAVSPFFAKLQARSGLSLPLAAYLIKPVQRIVKYEQLIEELAKCAPASAQMELKEALEMMHNVPLRANHVLHLRSLEGCADMERLGDFLLTESFHVWYPKTSKTQALFKKTQLRRIFLFETCLLFAKMPDSSAPPLEPGTQSKYAYKHRLMLSEINITEHVEGDECKFALWPGPAPPPEDTKTILKATSREVKQAWVRKIKELKLAQVLHFEDSRLLSAEVIPLKSNKPSQPGKPLDVGKNNVIAVESGLERSVSQPAFQILNQPQGFSNKKPIKNIQHHHSGAPRKDTESTPNGEIPSSGTDPIPAGVAMRKAPSLDLYKLKSGGVDLTVSPGPSTAGTQGGLPESATSPSTEGEDEASQDMDMPPPMANLTAPLILASSSQIQTPSLGQMSSLNSLKTEDLAKKLEEIATLPRDSLMIPAGMDLPKLPASDRPPVPKRQDSTGVSSGGPSGVKGGVSFKKEAKAFSSPKSKVKLLKVKSKS